MKQVFIKVNQYPKNVVDNTLKSVKAKFSENSTNPPEVAVDNNVTSVSVQEIVHPHIILPYNGFKGENVLRGFKKALNEWLPKNVTPRFVHKGKKLGSFFQIKDKISSIHRSNLVYGFHIPNKQTENFHYIGESKVRHETRIREHVSLDKHSSIYRHSQEHNYKPNLSNFTILAQGYDKWIDRRICEALFVRDYKPFLNKQKVSHKLELFT